MVVQSSRAQKRREAAAKLAREDILNAAERAFAKNGFRATKMSQIADEAGFTAASLYTYFDSKKAIFQALGRKMVEALYATLDQPAPEGLDLEGELRWRVSNLLSFTEQRRAQIKMFFDMQWRVDLDTTGDEREDGMQCTTDYFESFFARTEAQHPGTWRQSPTILAAALMGYIHAIFRVWLADANALAPNEQLEIILDLFLRGAHAGTEGAAR